MAQDFSRRKRKRKPTMNPRFVDSTLALEIGLVRLSVEAFQELEKERQKKQ